MSSSISGRPCSRSSSTSEMMANCTLGATHRDGVLAGLQADQAQLEDLPHHIHDIVHVSGCDRIADVEGLQGEPLVLPLHFLGVGGHNRALLRYGRPESGGHLPGDAHGSIEINVIHVKAHVPAVERRIVSDANLKGPADSVVKFAGIAFQMEV